MDLNLHHKVAIVTGASQGIGRAIAQTLAAEGMTVVIAARSADKLAELARQNPRLVPFAADLSTTDGQTALVAFTVERHGRLDLLVNNAGATKRGPFLDLPDQDWEAGFGLKFSAGMRCSRLAWPHLVEAGGAIVNIAGVGGRTASAEFTIGGSVNAAILNLTKALADQGNRDGVRVNAVNPGSILTDRLARRVAAYAADHGVTEAEAGGLMARDQGIVRFGRPDEIASVVAFLASPQAAYIQGAVIDVDGGQTKTL